MPTILSTRQPAAGKTLNSVFFTSSGIAALATLALVVALSASIAIASRRDGASARQQDSSLPTMFGP